jgi:hypothetical protein
MHIDPYTGHITWETGVSPYHSDGANYPLPDQLRPTGLEADASQRSTYTLLQPASKTDPQTEEGPEVEDSGIDYSAVLDVTYRSGGGYDLTNARCVAQGNFSVYDRECRTSPKAVSYADLTDSEKAHIYQGSRSYADLYCDSQQGYAGVWRSMRHYRTSQGCIRRIMDKPAKQPGLYPIVVIAYSKSYDGFKRSDGTSSASEVERIGIDVYASTLNPGNISTIQDQAYVKATINVNVYLYPALHYCSKECANSKSLESKIKTSVEQLRSAL